MTDAPTVKPDTCEVMGIKIIKATAGELCQLISSIAQRKQKSIIANVNINAMQLARKQQWFNVFLSNAEYVFCDGHGIMLAAKMTGQHIPEKITYADWLPQLAKHCDSEGLSIFLLGGKKGVADKAREVLQRNCSNLQIAGCHHGYFDMDPTSSENKQILDLINKAHPNILIVSFGMPLQEKWLKENWDHLNANVALPAGAALDYIAGTVKRPPKWMTDNGLEWFGRFIIEPKRLWRRYAIEMPAFFIHLATNIMRQKTSALLANPMKLFFSGVIASFLFILFHLLGNTADVHTAGRSIFSWLVKRWNENPDQMAHCFFIPLISAILLLRQSKNLKSAEKQTKPKALFVITAALLLHIISARTRLPRLACLSFVTLLWSIPWYLLGRQVARLIFFPCFYLLFCIPLTFLDSLTFPLRMTSASTTTFLLNGLGMQVIRIGTTISMPLAEGSIQLDVADACSGLRYFVVLLALSALYSHITQKNILKKCIIFASAVPIAMLANIVRISSITIAAYLLGEEIALNIYHDYSGYIVFATAVLFLMGCSKVINLNYKQKLSEWKQNRLNHA